MNFINIIKLGPTMTYDDDHIFETINYYKYLKCPGCIESGLYCQPHRMEVEEILEKNHFFCDPYPAHVIVPYDDNDNLDRMISVFFNEGLKRNDLCIYGTIEKEKTVKKLSSIIIDYESHVRDGNLLIVDLMQYYDSILKHDLTPLDDLKTSILEKEREGIHVRLYGELAGFLYKNKHFEECLLLENWWQSYPFGGTILCPYHNSVFKEYDYDEQEEMIIHAHDHVISC